MIQILNKDTTYYEYWGNEKSSISNGVNAFPEARVICSKNHPIPPVTSASSGRFGTSTSNGRSQKVYELEKFAHSIILYKDGGTPIASAIKTSIDSDDKLVSAAGGEGGGVEKKTLTNAPVLGYEIKLWLENEYTKPGGAPAMTKDDFNVITLDKTMDGTVLKFIDLEPPGKSAGVVASIAFNNLATDGVTVGNGVTVIQLQISDPTETVLGSPLADKYNNIINLVAVELQYANTIDKDPSEGDGGWGAIKTISYKRTTSIIAYDTFLSNLVATFSGGKHEFTPRVRDNIANYYYVKLNSVFLPMRLKSDSTQPTYHTFRVRYKNSSSTSWGGWKQSGSIQIQKPKKPVITSVKMTDYNKFIVEIATYGHGDDVIKTSGGSGAVVNTGYGVFLKEIVFDIKYAYSSDAYTLRIPLPKFSIGGLIDGTAGTDGEEALARSISITQPDGVHQYTFIVPHAPIQSDSIRYYFRAKVSNNIFQYSTSDDRFSGLSDVAANYLTISKPTADITTTWTVPSDKNNTITATWALPDTGRGVISAKTTGLFPILSKYSLGSGTLRYATHTADFPVHGTGTMSAAAGAAGDDTVTSATDETGNYYNADSTTLTNNFNFYEAVRYKASRGTGDVPVLPTKLDLTFKLYNQYVNTFLTTTSATNNVAIVAGSPGPPTTITVDVKNISPTATKNTLTLSWTAPETPANRGLSIGGTAVTNTILQYNIAITRTDTTNVYLKDHSVHNVSEYNLAPATKADGSAPYTGVAATNNADLTTSIVSSPTQKVVLWPATTYSCVMKAVNSLGYTSAGSVQTTFTTVSPLTPSGFTYLDAATDIAKLYTYAANPAVPGDTRADQIINLNAGVAPATDGGKMAPANNRYANSGMLISATNMGTLNTIPNTAVEKSAYPAAAFAIYDATDSLNIVQITNTNNLADIVSNSITHVLNKTHIQNFTTTLSHADIIKWVDTIDAAGNTVPISSNQARFEIKNIATGASIPDEYLKGTSSNFDAERRGGATTLRTEGLTAEQLKGAGFSVAELTDAGFSAATTPVGNTLFEIIRTKRKDIYSSTYDDKNRGYWFRESVQYKINLSKIKNDPTLKLMYLYKPLQFTLDCHYNSGGDDSSLTKGGTTTILKNSGNTSVNTSGNIYLDSLTGGPVIGKTSGVSTVITFVCPDADRINGIPNLAKSGATITLQYTVSNYSERYLLVGKNIVEHYFSYDTSATAMNGIINWNSAANLAGGIRLNNSWTIKKVISSPINGGSETIAYANATIIIKANNTASETTHLIKVGTGMSPTAIDENVLTLVNHGFATVGNGGTRVILLGIIPTNSASLDKVTVYVAVWRSINTFSLHLVADTALSTKINFSNVSSLAGFSISVPPPPIFKFINDMPSVGAYNSNSSSWQAIPANFAPEKMSTADFADGQSVHTSANYSTAINPLQMTLWGGFFYSNSGWKTASGINTPAIGIDHGINIVADGSFGAAPVFSTDNTGYNWVIFNYTGTNAQSTTHKYYSVVCDLSSSYYTANDLKGENIVVYFYNRGSYFTSNVVSKKGDWYWSKISTDSGFSDINASNETSASNIQKAGTFEYDTGTGKNGQITAMESKEGNTPYILHGVSGQRLLCGWTRLNNILPTQTITNFYLAIGVKKTDTTIYISPVKPSVYLKQLASEGKEGGVSLQLN